MVTPKTQYSLKNARSYFKEHLAHGDYYSEKETVQGQWMGAGATSLGLRGVVGQKEFLALCDGKRPDGSKLTARTNTVRNVGGVEQANRRVFFDFVIRPPKSVSLVALCSDERVVALHDEAVKAAVTELERHTATRVRKDGARTQRTTGNMVAAVFRHDSSRDLDPLLHSHCVVFNATFDAVENRWKALENSDMLKAQKLVASVYDAHLTAGLVKMGYGIRREGESYEIETVKRATIEKFSKRRMSIEEAADREFQKVGGKRIDLFKLRDRIAHNNRARKRKNANAATLRDIWLTGLTVDERDALKPGERKGAGVPREDAVKRALEIAEGMVFERHAVVPRPILEAAILNETLGSGATLEEVRDLVNNERYVGAKDGSEFASHEGLRAELAVLEAAKSGRQTCSPLVGEFSLQGTPLDAEQVAAVSQILESRDFITLFRGLAGTGKSFALRYASEAIEGSGRELVVVAPQTGQVRDLVKDGMKAQTLTSLLWQKQLGDGAVVILDEAGQVGARQMRELVELVKARNGRLVLSGDTRQHGAVEASDALLAIERYAGLKAAEIRTVRRQDEKLGRTPEEVAKIAGYKAAVLAASEGQMGDSLLKLKAIGAIKRVAENKRADAVAAAVVEDLAAGIDVLAVTQTRAEALSVNEAVAVAAEKAGLVRDVRKIDVLVPKDLLTMEKKLGRSYSVGDEVLFLGRYGKHRAGELRKVVHVEGDVVFLEPKDAETKAVRLSLKYAEKWNIVERRELAVGVGSKIQMKLNAKAADGRRIVNGEVCSIVGFEKDGSIRVHDGVGEKTVKPEQKVMLAGYCVTSYSAQGKSVESVVLSDSGSRQASHRREWYVSISRARRNIRLFTSDLRGLAERIGRDGSDKLAMELDREEPAPLSPARRLALRRSFGVRLAAKVREVVQSHRANLWKN